MKHKHCKVIKAWADGARIEKLYVDGEWGEDAMPYFSINTEYRVMKVTRLVKVEGWINIYINGYYSKIYESKQIAENEAIEHIPHKTIFISEEIEVEE